MIKFIVLSLISILCLATMAIAKTEPICLKNGDRIVFLGDSITARGAMPRGYLSLIREAIDRHHGPGKITTICAGVEGNRVVDVQRRVYKDAVEKRPNVAVIYIGINDVWWGYQIPELATPPDEFKSRLENLAASVEHCGAKVMLCTPSVIGEKTGSGNHLDPQLEVASETVRKIAQEHHYALCDLRKGFVDYLNAHNPDDKIDGILTVDGVHLNDQGNKLVAKLMLEALGECGD